MKCRLCLCYVDKKIGYSSLLDTSFSSMVKRVFSMELLTHFTIGNQEYMLPMMVCIQCSATVRSFYGFSKVVEANQKNLRLEHTAHTDDLSADELLQSIKRENGSGPDGNNKPCEDVFVTLHTQLVDQTRENGNYVFDSQTPGNVMIKLNDKVSRGKKRSYPAERDEIIESVSEIAKRINGISVKLEGALHKNIRPNYKSQPISPVLNPSALKKGLVLSR